MLSEQGSNSSNTMPEGAIVPNEKPYMGGMWHKNGTSLVNEEQRDQMKSVDRMLQKGACTRDANDIMRDADEVGLMFLSFGICPTVEAAVAMNLAAEMVNFYKVDSEELNSKVQKSVLKIDMEALKEQVEAQEISQAQLEKKSMGILRLNEEEFNELSSSNPTKYEAAMRVAHDQVKRDITFRLVKEHIEQNADNIFHGLESKPLLEPGKNQDISILGAQASGKSTAAKELIEGQEKDYSRAVSVDDFRHVQIPGVKEPEYGKMDILLSQNFAFFAKAMAMDAMVQRDNDKISRPNLLVDAVTQDPKVSTILKNTKSVLVAYAPANTVDIGLRSYNRAAEGRGANLDTMNTVYGAHKNVYASSQNVPIGHTEILNTDVKKGERPEQLGLIDKKSEKEISLEVYDVKMLSEYYDKKNINKKAEKGIELSGHVGSKRIDTSKRKAEALMGVLDFEKGKDKPFKEIAFKSAPSAKPYLEIAKGEDGRLSVKYDYDQMREVLQKNGEITRDILQNVFEQAGMKVKFQKLAVEAGVSKNTPVHDAAKDIAQQMKREISSLTKAGLVTNRAKASKQQSL